MPEFLPNLLYAEILKPQNRYLGFFQTINGKARRKLCPNLFWTEILKPQNRYLIFPDYRKMKRSVGGSAQRIYFGQKHLSLE